MADLVFSVNEIPIRLTEERWRHIVEEHGELSGMRAAVISVVAKPIGVYAGNAGELLAIQEIEPEKWLVVVYREINSDDGFVITAFFTRRKRSLDRRNRLWP